MLGLLRNTSVTSKLPASEMSKSRFMTRRLQNWCGTFRAKLLGAELMSKLKKLDLEGIDFAKAKVLASAASEAVRARRLGYAFVLGRA